MSEEAEARLEGSSLEAAGRNSEMQTSLQDALLPLLRDYLLRADASGAYVLLDTTSNPGAGTHCGLYLQKKTMAPSENSLLLYRGKAGVGRKYGILPHRKWRMELGPELFCGSGQQIPYGDFPEAWSYHYTPIFTLPGTSEQAMLLQVPLRGQNGDFLGLCGFEISQTYFKEYRQPALYPRLSFMLTAAGEGEILPADKLVAGTTSNYFLNPTGSMKIRDAGHSLQEFQGEDHSFIGLSRMVSLSGDPRTIAVMLPREEYRHLLLQSLVHSLLLMALLAAFAVTCCVFFSRIYLMPILRGLEELKDRKPAKESGVREIDDLFRYLLSQDQAHEDALRVLEDEKNRAQNRAALIQREYEKVRQEYLASRCVQPEIRKLQEIDSAEYEAFRRGLSELTVTERKIVQYYFAGKTVKEIQALMDIKETTLRYHNRNIYGKLGVHSMKQLLRFAMYAGKPESG